MNPSLLRRLGLPALAVLLLGAHFFIALHGKLDWSTTSDEIAHITAGHVYWAHADFRLQPENGNLPQRWAGIPAWLSGDKLPPDHQAYWETSDVWVLGHAYFYELGNNLAQLLLRARAMNLVWSLACGALVCAWAWRLFGAAGGLVALTFYALDPNFLAHGALATSDMCMTFFMLAAVGAWWRHLHDLSWRSGALSAAVFALACVAKFSAVLLLPMFLLLLAVRRGQGPLPGRRGALALSLLGHASAAVFTIWAFFAFRFSAAGHGLPAMQRFIADWEPLLYSAGWQGRVVSWLRGWHALPEAFLYGYNYVVANSQQRATFIDGEYSITGWVKFFPLTFLYKTPLPFLSALVVAASITLAHWRRVTGAWRGHLYRAAPLLVLFVVYWAFSLTSHLNIGHRHILPIYPVLFIFAGVIGWRAAAAWRTAGLATVALLVWSAVEVARIHPHELAYFNQIAGGPSNGWRHLADSSLDWGQDLPGLADWLRKKNSGPKRQNVYYSYFGSGEPSYYGIRGVRLPAINGFRRDQVWYRPGPGLYCVSVTMLQAVYLRPRGDWTAKYESDYQQLRALEGAFHDYAADPVQRANYEKMQPREKWTTAWKYYDELRLARISIYLRAKKPLAQIGYSIFVYELTEAELAATLAGRFTDVSNAVQRLKAP